MDRVYREAMMLRSLFQIMLLCVACVWVQFGHAWAAENPMMAAYKAYNSALQRGDDLEAERQAELALNAAEAVSSDKRGILALNLAVTRLRLGKRVEAIAPAIRAEELGKTGNAGLNNPLVELVVARSQLDGEKSKTLDQLQDAVDSAIVAKLDSGYIYDAAVDLGKILLLTENYRESSNAWRAAYSYAADDIEKAGAIINNGISEIYDGQADKGVPLLDQALKLLVPLLPAERVEWTPADILFSRVRAWRAVGVSTLSEADRKKFASFNLTGFPLPNPDYCQFKLKTDPLPRYPRSQEFHNSIASLILGFDVQQDGAIRNVRILASAPEIGGFSESVLKVASLWRAEKVRDAPEGCKLARRYLDAVISFRVEQ